MNEANRSTLKKEATLNPFNDKFSLDQFMKFSKFKDEIDFEEEMIHIIHTFSWLNLLHKEFYQILAKIIKSTDRDAGKVIDLIFVGYNRNYFVIKDQIKEEFKCNDDFNMFEFSNKRLTSHDSNEGGVGLIAMMETEVDSLNLVANLIRHLLQEPFKDIRHEEPVKPIQFLQTVHKSSAIYYTLKSIYEDTLWNNGNFSYNTYNKTIHTTFPDSKRLHAKKVGHYRMQAVSFHHSVLLNSLRENKGPWGLSFLNKLKLSKKKKGIKNINIENSIIKIILEDLPDVNLLDLQIMQIAMARAYYPFLELDQVTPKSNGLSVWDFIHLLSAIQYALDEVTRTKIDTSLFSMDDLKRYPIKFSSSHLLNFLEETTSYTLIQISFFLHTISCSFDNRVDLWTYPILLYGEYYYFSYISLTSPVTVNLIDNWLNKTGYELDKRGKLFESYIENQLEDIFRKNSFHFEREKRKKITLNSSTEEIDLIFSLNKVAFVCEVKCMKYATAPREDHNSYETLCKASVQAIRKSKFIQNGFTYDASLKKMLSGKKIVPLIITNYPLYTGLNIDGIPIVDFHLLESYFATGKRSTGYYENINGEIVIVPSSFEIEYSNEDELNNKVEEFIKNPTHIVKLIENHEIATQKFTPDSFNFSLYSEFSTSNSVINYGKTNAL